MIKATYIDHMGTDKTVVNAARNSFGKDSLNDKEPIDEGDIRLIKFLARGVPLDEWEGYIDFLASCKDKDEIRKIVKYIRNIPEHFIPFAHPQISIIEEMPIFTARQRYKHKIGFVESEASMRYITGNKDFYTPDEWRSKPEGNIKQGSGTSTVEIPTLLKSPTSVYENSGEWKGVLTLNDYKGMSDEDKLEYTTVDIYQHSVDTANDTYEKLLAAGVAPEQARMVLPQSMLIRTRITGSLYAFAQAYIKRIDAHAQKEIQILAGEWDKIIRPLFPISWAALADSDYD